ncbi:hypothetical protein SAMN05720766_109108 [Fibrobacter sp. UWH9]|uniref:hypothetical protein n=1 Tax=Fibrobacter sp. UWH9 TaxID=1896213 RepID=UPI000918107E|nr:hypothetical protein [Fibrobacter sp. UWH9]SHH27155.1 hypothetical protein SAMN05720766_109108 [Fibrobacter sp. UWH9]
MPYIYNLAKTRQFAANFKTVTEDYPSLIKKEGGANDLKQCPNFEKTECVSGDQYASEHPELGMRTKSGDSLFAIDYGRNFKVVIAEMKFRCDTKGSCENLASDIKEKTVKTKQHFTGAIFHDFVYVLVDSGKQRLLNTLCKQLTGGKIKYKVTTLQEMHEKFFTA